MSGREPTYYHAQDSRGGDSSALSHLDAVLESSYDGIYITDGDANTIKLNSSYEIISGLKRADVMGRNMRELVASRVMSESGTLLALESRGAVTLEQKFKTGKRAIITSTPTFDDSGNIVMVVTNVRDITEIHSLRQQLTQEAELTKKQLTEMELIRKQIIGSDNMVAVDKRMLQTMLTVNKVAGMDTVVLLLGETGVGKEMVATYICQNSGRREKNFIKVNCGAIPAQLVESELFGYAPGAFTGADKDGKPGLFEVADKGTIFLDEVGDLPMEVQVKLLRVIQEGEVQRVGAARAHKVDVRILAATNRNLEEMVEQKLFRKDLYYRISVFPITIPPLRERPGDILPLARSILKELNGRYSLKKELSPSAGLDLEAYDWPGNVRELRNVVERAMILSADNVSQTRELAIPRGFLPPIASLSLPDEPVNLKSILEQIEEGYIRRAYEKHRNVRKAAKSLLMDPATYVRKRKKYMERG